MPKTHVKQFDELTNSAKTARQFLRVEDEGLIFPKVLKEKVQTEVKNQIVLLNY